MLLLAPLVLLVLGSVEGKLTNIPTYLHTPRDNIVKILPEDQYKEIIRTNTNIILVKLTLSVHLFPF